MQPHSGVKRAIYLYIISGGGRACVFCHSRVLTIFSKTCWMAPDDNNFWIIPRDRLWFLRVIFLYGL